MVASLLQEARIWPVIWRRRLAGYWLEDAKDNLAFVVMIGLVITGVVGIVYFAYRAAPSVEPAQIESVPREESVQREATDAQRRETDLQCLAENIYFEARGEPPDGQYAVAEVTLNRTHSRNFPHSICAVVHETRWDPGRRRFVADFSWTELGAPSPDDGPAWRQAMAVAAAAYDDQHAPVVPGALFYHATSIRPGWARSRTAIATIGKHVFYR
jgi:N-acetylmuramoyl-L-alanine amidase